MPVYTVELPIETVDNHADIVRLDCDQCGQRQFAWGTLTDVEEAGACCASCVDASHQCAECETYYSRDSTDIIVHPEHDENDTESPQHICTSCADDAFSECGVCPSIVRNDSLTYLECDELYVCESCRDDAYTCDHCDELTMDDCGDRYHTLCQGCRDEHYYTCDYCCNLTHCDQTQYVDSADVTVCDSCYENNYFYCDDCNTTYHTDDYGGDGRCTSCYTCDCGDCEECGYSEEGLEKTCIPTTRNYCDDVTDRDTFGITIPDNLIFGVELETSQAPCPRPDVWREVSDGSISGMEYVSPILKGTDGLLSVRDTCRSLASGGAKVDSRCGFHLHLNAAGLSFDTFRRFVAFCLDHEEWFKSVVPSTRRNHRYCQDSELSADVVRDSDTFLELAEAVYGSHNVGSHRTKYVDERYNWLNLHSYFYRGTIEIRLHSGTINARKVMRWVELFGAIMDASQRLNDDDMEGIRTPADLLSSDAIAYFADRHAKFNRGRRPSWENVATESDTTESTESEPIEESELCHA